MAPFSSLSQLDKLLTPVSKGREGASPSPGFPVPPPASQDSRRQTGSQMHTHLGHKCTQPHENTRTHAGTLAQRDADPVQLWGYHAAIWERTLSSVRPGRTVAPEGDRLDRVAQCHRYPNRGLRRWLWRQLAQAGVEDAGSRVGPCSCPGQGGPTHLSLSSFSVYPGHPRTCR